MLACPFFEERNYVAIGMAPEIILILKVVFCFVFFPGEKATSISKVSIVILRTKNHRIIHI